MTMTAKTEEQPRKTGTQDSFAKTGDSAVISIRGLSKYFDEGKTVALSGISAEISPGRITGLVGPDGAGKTTLMRLLAGILNCEPGCISVCGFDPAESAEDIHRFIGYMPQRFGLYGDLSVIENLSLHAELQGVELAKIQPVFERLLKFTDLERFQGRLAGRLSGGMKQKLGLACALLRKPRVLLLDEPSVGVDPLSRRELWKMVRELSDNRTCILWSTAYLDEAERCDDVLLLNSGKLLFKGTPEELTRRVAGRTFLLGSSSNNRRKLLSGALLRDEVMDGVIQGSYVRLMTAPSSELPDMHDSGAESVRQVPARFEDAFVDILGGHPKDIPPLGESIPEIPPSAEAVVQTIGLTKKFGEFTAVNNVSFNICPGRIFGLLGPNGAGKSTTFKMLCGLIRPSSGRALVCGIDLAHSPGKARSRLGYMAQKFSLYDGLSVEQNLRFFSGVYGLRGKRQRERILEMEHLFGLSKYMSSSTAQLPLGYKQRLALACSVMHNPAVLFLDEPTSGVDPLTRREFWKHINSLVEKGVAIVVTTHFMDEAEYCDDIALIYRGQMISSGAPDKLKENARSEKLPDPTLEDAFIALIREHDQQGQEDM